MNNDITMFLVAKQCSAVGNVLGEVTGETKSKTSPAFETTV